MPPASLTARPDLIGVAWLEDEQAEMLQSGFRVVADYLVKRRRHGKEYVPSARELDHVEAVVELIGALTGDSRYKDALEEARARGREVTTMDALIDSLLERGEARGIAKGKEEGKQENKREMVLRMVEEGGVSVAWIARVSGLTADEVLDIAKDARRPSQPR